MRGKPKFLNTKQDYYNVLELGEDVITKAEKKQLFEDLLSNVNDWIVVGPVEEGKGIEDETHKVVASEPMMEGDEVTYTQFVFAKNEGARIFQLGFTVEEVQGIIANLG
jgi:hypothetical protein